MCSSLRLSIYELDDAQLDELSAWRRHDEIHISSKNPKTKVLILRNGHTELVSWGVHVKSRLPQTSYCKSESLEAGKWQWLKPERVQIVASLAFSKGVWFQVRQGIEAILVHDAEGLPICYMLTSPATHYYKTMTGAERMPCLINQIV